MKSDGIVALRSRSSTHAPFLCGEEELKKAINGVASKKAKKSKKSKRAEKVHLFLVAGKQESSLHPPEDLKATPFYHGTAVHFACPHCTTYTPKLNVSTGCTHSCVSLLKPLRPLMSGTTEVCGATFSLCCSRGRKAYNHTTCVANMRVLLALTLAATLASAAAISLPGRTPALRPSVSAFRSGACRENHLHGAHIDSPDPRKPSSRVRVPRADSLSRATMRTLALTSQRILQAGGRRAPSGR